MAWMTAWILLLAGIPLISLLYIRNNDRKLMRLPPEAVHFSPRRVTEQTIRDVAERLAKSPQSIRERLPPRTGRRYIVVGGSGFLGGWIVLHLLQRGEDPRRIRILDMRAPTRPDLTTGPARDIDFRKVDITNGKAVSEAFKASWPSDDSEKDGLEPEVTVFHTASSIRFYERHISLWLQSAKVNVAGTRNILNAAHSINATALIYTSSGSISVRRSRFWLWPWQKEPNFFVQVLNDDDNIIPKEHDHFFSNYAATKREAERLVREANGTPSGTGLLKTGCIRPGNGIYGSGGDMLCGAYLVRKDNPTWIGHVLQSFAYVENVSLAHLCYEQRLLESMQGSTNPDISGQAFVIADRGPPITYGDVYVALSALTNGEVTFPVLSPSAMLLLAHILEMYHVYRHFLLSSAFSLWRFIGSLLPPIGGDLVNLQPAMFALTMVHLIFDDSRARLPPEKGGLGYRGVWTTEEGLCTLVDQFRKGGGKGEERSLSGGVSIGLGLMKAQRGIKNVDEKLGNGFTKSLEVDPAKTLN